jgi:hypothetical protein
MDHDLQPHHPNGSNYQSNNQHNDDNQPDISSHPAEHAWQSPEPQHTEPQAPAPVWNPEPQSWNTQSAHAGMMGGSTESPVTYASNGLSSGHTATDQPVAVVKVLSVRGLEYLLMMLSLWIADSALLWTVLAMINGAASFSVLAAPIATLLVSVPVFGYLFLRLKKAEIADPSLRFDPSKRRTTQITQIFTFLVVMFNIIGFLYEVIAKLGGNGGMSLVKAFFNMLFVLIIVGGIFAYYWIDEHKTRR